MARFRSYGSYRKSFQNSACRDLAKKIARGIEEMGLDAYIEASRISASHYVHVDGMGGLKIRVSDHANVSGDRPDLDIRCHQSPVDVWRWVAAQHGVDVESVIARYHERADAAARAAKTRSENARANEAEMLAAVIEALKAEKTHSKLMAGKVIDRLFPNAPRAQRQRVAYDASYQCKKA